MSAIGVLDVPMPSDTYLLVKFAVSGLKIPVVGAVGSLPLASDDSVDYIDLLVIPAETVGGTAGQYFIQIATMGPNRKQAPSGVFTASDQFVLEFGGRITSLVYLDVAGVAQRVPLIGSIMPVLFSGPSTAGAGVCSCDMSPSVVMLPALAAAMEPAFSRFDPSAA